MRRTQLKSPQLSLEDQCKKDGLMESGVSLDMEVEENGEFRDPLPEWMQSLNLPKDELSEYDLLQQGQL